MDKYSINMTAIYNGWERNCHFYEWTGCPPSGMLAATRQMFAKYAHESGAFPLKHQGLIRSGFKDFKAGELVVHIGALETLKDIYLKQITKVEEYVSEGKTLIHLEPVGHLLGSVSNDK
jgi:hypothetical protein